MAIEDFDQVTIAPAKLRPFSKFIMSIGELPTSYLDSLSYAEQVTWFCDYLQNKVIPAIDNNAEALEEVQHLITELQEYVNNYFTNLDVQDEIDTKLDDMVEQGTLQEIIADYLNSKAVFGFDTVASMKSSTNLINGSYAETLGYYEKNDGGSALYKIREITNDDVIDEMFILALDNDNLIAELIINNNTIDFRQVGDNFDVFDTTKFEKIIFEKDEYTTNKTITINRKLEIDLNGATLEYTGNTTLFDITTLYNIKPTIKNGIFIGSTTNTFITSYRNAWGASFDLLNSDVRKFNYIFNCTENFNNYIKGVNFSSNGIYSFTGTNISNEIKFEKCYFKTYDKLTDVYPDYRFILTMVRNMQFNTCSFEQCKTVFKLTSCNFINVTNCNFEDVDYISNTNQIKIENNNGFLNEVRGIYENETIRGIPYGNYLHANVYSNVTDTANRTRSTMRNNNSLPRTRTYGTYIGGTNPIPLYDYTDKEINYFVPFNKLISKQETAGTEFIVNVSNNITYSQRDESILFTIYNIFTSSGEDFQVWKSQFIQRDSYSLYKISSECVRDATWSSSPLYGNTITETLTNQSYTVTSSVSCKKVTIICFEMLGNSLVI